MEAYQHKCQLQSQHKNTDTKQNQYKYTKRNAKETKQNSMIALGK